MRCRGELGAIRRVYKMVKPSRGSIRPLATTPGRPPGTLEEGHLRIVRVLEEEEEEEDEMGSIMTKLCNCQPNPLLSLNDTCQRLRCLMACCGGNVNVVSRGDADVTDAGVQTDECYEKTTDNDKETNKDEEEEEEDGDETDA